MEKKVKDEDIYESVRKILDGFPMGAPKREEIFEFLREVLEEEEAEIFTKIPRMPLKATCEDISGKIGYSIKKTKSILKQMAGKGVISSHIDENGSESFMVVPLMPGILEYVFAATQDNDKRNRLSSILEKYLKAGYIHEVHSSNYPFMRVIPIDKKIDARSTILPFEEASNILDKAKSIAVINCACRSIERKCPAPIETCIMLDSAADHVISYMKAKRLTPEEGHSLLEETEKYGLVHMTINTQLGSSGICSCCPCCCMLLKGLIEYNNPRSFVKSNFITDINHSLCTKCSLCIDICPVRAMYLYLGHDGTGTEKNVQLIPERCIGCGLCTSHCPTDAISLKRVREYIPEKTIGKAWGRFLREKVS